MSSTGTAARHESLYASALEHLQNLLRINTSNPPGNELEAAKYIADVCNQEGIEAEIVESAPGRANVVARLRSESATKRPFMLMGHYDVVTIEAEKWTVDPFGGELKNGYVWGRGALDMKSMVAAELAVLLALKRQGVSLDRDIILAIFADEEAGGTFGAQWMWEHRRDLLDAEYALNEGGGTAIRLNDQTFYLCQAGEKGAARLRITAKGSPGHASVPLDDTAMKRIGEALVRLTSWQAPTQLTEPVRQMLQTIAPALGPSGETVIQQLLDAPAGALTWNQIAALNLPLDDDTMLMLRATTRNTAVPTIIHGGHRINVIPSEVVLDADGRILPGQDPDEWRDTVQQVVGEDVTVELLSRESGIMADPASPLFEAIKETIAEMDPGAKVAPFLVSGGTDARHLPDVKVYGFFPFPPTERNAEYSPLIHGHDERIAVEDLNYGTRFIYEVVTRFCGAE